MITYSDFYKKFVNRTFNKLLSPLIVDASTIRLPKQACIHYIPENNTELGVTMGHPLLQNVKGALMNYHVEELVIKQGKVKKKPYNTKKALKDYRKKQRAFTIAKDFDKAIENDRLPLVLDYSFIPNMYKYTEHNLNMYNEWVNSHYTMLENIRRTEGDRNNFIVIKLPKLLPARDKMEYYKDNGVNVKGLEYFRQYSSFELLAIWKLMDPDRTPLTATVPEQVINSVTIAFTEGTSVCFFKLADLINWGKEQGPQGRKDFFKFLENLMSTRVVVPETTIDSVDVSDTPVSLEANVIRTIQEKARAGTLTSAQQVALERKAEKYKTIPNPTGEGTLADMLEIKEEEHTLEHEPIAPKLKTIADPSMLLSSINAFDSKYVEQVLDKDIVRMIMMLQKNGIIIEDIKAKAVHNVTNEYTSYTVKVLPAGGTGSTFHFDIPKVGKDGYFMTNGVKGRLLKQKGDLPLIKVKPHVMAISSFYGKMFINRSQTVSNNYGKWLKKKVEKVSLDPESIVTNVAYGITSYGEEHLPRSFTAIGETIGVIETGKYKLDFRLARVRDKLSEADKKLLGKQDLIPCGHKGKALLGMDKQGIVYDVVKDEALGSIPTLLELGSEGPNEYTEMTVFSKSLPLIMYFCYLMGIEQAFKHLGIKYQEVPLGTRHAYGDDVNYYPIKFKDTTILCDLSNPEHSLLISGFNAIRKDVATFKFTDLNEKRVYLSLLGRIGMTGNHLRELTLINDMFVDPITESVLIELDMPTTIKGLLLEANRYLVDDSAPKSNASVYKGYERIPGMLYSELITSLRVYAARRNFPDITFSVHPRSVYLDIVMDESKELIDEINPIKAIREKETVTFSGKGGRSGRVITREDIGFTPDDIGVISESNPDSKQTGVRSYTVSDPKLRSVRGLTDSFDPKTDGAGQTVSTTMLLSPAGDTDRKTILRLCPS